MSALMPGGGLSPDAIVPWLVRGGSALGLLLLFWMGGRLLARVLLRLGGRAAMDVQVLRLLARTLRVAAATFGLVTALGTLGVDVSALVAGLGLTGFALGFALRDSVSNLIAGVLILLYRPFAPGDHIEVAGFAGRVASIDLRYTELHGETRRVLIPNSRLFTDPIAVRPPAPASGPGSEADARS